MKYYKRILGSILGVVLGVLMIYSIIGNEEGAIQTIAENKMVKLSNKDTIKEVSILKRVYDESQKVAFLTFDDGPSKNTEEILNILKKENVKATFFVNGHDTDFARRMYKRIVKEGHTIANHTYSHSYEKVYKSQNSFIEDIIKLDDFIYNITGSRTEVVRFPGGSNNHVNRKYSGCKNNTFMEELADKLESAGYVYFDWTVDSTDASRIKQPVNKIVGASISEALKQKYPIILFHDAPVKVTTVEALPNIIKKLKDNGYIMDVLSKNVPVSSSFLKETYGEKLK